MNPLRTLVGLASLLALAPAVTEARGNMVVENTTGNMHIHLAVTAASDINGDVPIARGRVEIAPPEGLAVPGGRFFMVTAAQLQMADFNVDHSLYPEQRFRE